MKPRAIVFDAYAPCSTCAPWSCGTVMTSVLMLTILWLDFRVFRSHFHRSGTSLQAFASGLRPWAGNPEGEAGGYSIRVLELVGCMGS